MESPVNISALPPISEAKGGLEFGSLFNIYCQCLGAILLASAILKAVSSFGTAPILQLPDPIFGLDSRWVYLLSAVVELVVGMASVSQWISARQKATMLTWLGVCFACYRSGLWLGGFQAPCPCLGRAAEWWPWLALHGSLMTKMLMFLLCVTWPLRVLKASGLHFRPRSLVLVALFASASLHLSADELATQRVRSYTNHVALVGTRGCIMRVKYTDAPDRDKSPRRLDNGEWLIPKSKQFVEIVKQNDVFWFDETVGGPQEVKLPDAKKPSVLIKGFVTGFYPTPETLGPLGSSMLYYYEPDGQFSFSVLTNGIAPSGGWVEKMVKSKQEMAQSILRFLLPAQESGVIIGSDTVTMTGISGESNSVGYTISPDRMRIKFELNSVGSPMQQVVEWEYANLADPLPAKVDHWLKVIGVEKTIRKLSLEIIDVRYPDSRIANLPAGALQAINRSENQEIFQVSGEVMTQILQTNQVRVVDSKDRLVSPRKASAFRIFALSGMTIITLFAAWKSFKKTT